MTIPRADGLGEDHYRLSASQRRLLPFLIRFAIACLALAAAAAAMADEVPSPTCFPVANVHQTLAAQYGEEPVVRGLQSNGLVLELWASKGGRTWTQVIVGPDGTACIVSIGKDIEVRQHTQDEEPA